MKTLIALALFSSTLSFAQTAPSDGGGNGAGNGGDGLRIGEHTYVLDLVEAGVELEPYFDPSVVVDPTIQTDLAPVFAAIPDFPWEAFSRKLSEVQAIDPVFGLQIRIATSLYQWTLVNPALIDIPDSDNVLEYPVGTLVQLAGRLDQIIRISRDAWKLLDPTNRAALILHEILYALVIPEFDSPENKYYVQQSRIAKDVNGYLFSPRLKTGGRQGLQRLAGSEGDYLSSRSGIAMPDSGKFTHAAHKSAVIYLYSGDDMKWSLQASNNDKTTVVLFRFGDTVATWLEQLNRAFETLGNPTYAKIDTDFRLSTITYKFDRFFVRSRSQGGKAQALVMGQMIHDPRFSHSGSLSDGLRRIHEIVSLPRDF